MNKDNETKMAILRDGMGGEFWNIIIARLDETLAAVEEEMDSDSLNELPAEEYKVRSRVLREQRNYLRDLKELPNTVIVELQQIPGTSNEEETQDVYLTQEEMT